MSKLDRIKKYLRIVLGDSSYLSINFEEDKVKIFCDAGFEVELVINEQSIKLFNNDTCTWE